MRLITYIALRVYKFDHASLKPIFIRIYIKNYKILRSLVTRE